MEWNGVVKKSWNNMSTIPTICVNKWEHSCKNDCDKCDKICTGKRIKNYWLRMKIAIAISINEYLLFSSCSCKSFLLSCWRNEYKRQTASPTTACLLIVQFSNNRVGRKFQTPIFYCSFRNFHLFGKFVAVDSKHPNMPPMPVLKRN